MAKFKTGDLVALRPNNVVRVCTGITQILVLDEDVSQGSAEVPIYLISDGYSITRQVAQSQLEDCEKIAQLQFAQNRKSPKLTFTEFQETRKIMIPEVFTDTYGDYLDGAEAVQLVFVYSLGLHIELLTNGYFNLVTDCHDSICLNLEGLENILYEDYYLSY